MPAERFSRRPVSQRWLRAALALCLGVAGVGAAVDPGSAPVAAAEVEDAAVSAAVTVAPSSSGVLRPDEDLRVTAVISNTGSEPLPEGSARLILGTDRIRTSAELNAWLRPREDAARPDGVRLDTENVAELPRGVGARSIDFDVPVDELAALAGSPWGAYRLWVEFRADGAGAVLGRSSVVWAPSDAPARAGLAAALPLTVPPTESGVVTPDDLARYTSDVGILTRQLDAVEGRDVALGIDPMILASIRVLGSSAPPSALAWLERLESLDNETFLLPYGDPDLAAVSQSERGLPAPQDFDFLLDAALFADADLEPTTSPSADIPGATASPDEPDPTASPPAEPVDPEVPTREQLLAWDGVLDPIAWPAERTVVGGDLETFADEGFPTTILAEGNVSAAVRSTESHARIGEHDALVADALLSALLREAAAARTTEEWRAAVADLGAALAVIAVEHTGTAPLSLATLGRSRPSAQSRIGQTLEALERLDWVETSTLSELLERPARSTRIVDRPVDEDRVRAVRRLLRMHAAESDFATVAEDPADITAPRRLRALGLLSQSWRQSPDAWFDEVEEFVDESRELRQSVQLVESSQVNLLSDLERLPVSIRNSLDVPVTVYVNVRSESTELIIRDNHLEVPVEPLSTARQFVIPVRSLTNGTADIVISLVSRTGEPIGEPTRLTVNVQAGWGAAGAVVIGVLVAGLFAVGIYRTFGSGRRRRTAGRADD